MSRPKDDWWGYARKVIRRYPEYEEKLRDLQKTSITPKYNPVGGSSGPGRMTEQAALRQLPPYEQACYDVVKKAIDSTRRKKNGKERVEIIKIYHFRKSHNLAGAAMQVYVSETTAKEWHREFVHLVIRNMKRAGLLWNGDQDNTAR